MTDLTKKWTAFLNIKATNRRGECAKLLERQRLYQAEKDVDHSYFILMLSDILKQLTNHTDVEWSVGDGDRTNPVDIEFDFDEIELAANGTYYYGLDRETAIISEYVCQIVDKLEKLGRPVVFGRRPLMFKMDGSMHLQYSMDLL